MKVAKSRNDVCLPGTAHLIIIIIVSSYDKKQY